MLSDEQLAALESTNGRVVVAYSGGCDSHALLHYLVTHFSRDMEALHINHGLHADADQWQSHCEQVCDELKIPLTSFTVSVSREGSLETNARAARYAVFERFLEVGDRMLFAHHQDDQIETILLNLTSGRAPFGVLGMPETRQLGLGVLERPLLRVPQQTLVNYAESADLRWVEDPSNADTRHERNRLRHTVIPLLAEQYPNFSENLQAAWDNTSEVMRTIEGQAADDLSVSLIGQGALDLEVVADLGEFRAERCLKQFLQQLGYEKIPGSRLLHDMRDVLTTDTGLSFDLGQYTLQSYHKRIYAIRKAEPESAPIAPREGRVDFSGGVLSTNITKGSGISVPANQLLCQVRAGGEEILLRGHHHKLKNLLQEFHFPACVRQQLPLIWLDGEFIGVCGIPNWDLPMVVADEYLVSEDEFGCELLWQPPS
jgi:tRNA(Ile)-lysidine synthase